MRLAAIVVGSWLVCVPLIGVVWADELTDKYLEQLRQRRLFSVAEGYCLRQLMLDQLHSTERANLTLELSRTLAEHAKHSTGREQADLWKRAVDVLDDFLEKEPRSPRRLMLEVQAAFVAASQVEYRRWPAELQSYDEGAEQKVLVAVKAVIPRLTELEERLADHVRTARHRGNSDGGELPYHQARTLLLNVRYRLAIVLLGKFKMLSKDSAERAAVMVDAEERLRQLTGGARGAELTWHSQVLLAQAHRLRNDWKRADGLLATLEKSEMTAEVRNRVVAERVRLLMATKNVTDAAKLLVNYRKAGIPMPGELRFLNVKVLLALWKVAVEKKQMSLADGLMQQIQAYVGQTESELAGYWGRRCRLFLELAREKHEFGDELALIIRKARSLYLMGKVDDAVKNYGMAANVAHLAGKEDLAMELGYTRASIQLQASQFSAAARSFHDLGNQYPSNPRTPNAHLLWSFCLGKLYNQEPSDSRLTAYTKALVDHRAKFSDGSTIAEATWMFAVLQERQCQVTRALKLYEEIPAEHRRSSNAQLSIARCYEKILARLHEQHQPTADWERVAIDQLDSFIAMFSKDARSLTQQQAEIIMRLARIRLNRRPSEFAEADQLLERILAGRQFVKQFVQGIATPAYDAWQRLFNMSAQLRIVSLAGQQRLAQARALLKTFSASSPSEVLSVLDGLIQIADNVDEHTRRGLADLQLQAAEGLNARRSQLSVTERRRLDSCLAQACVATDQPRRAVEKYDVLLRESPRDKRLRRTVSELMTQIRTPEYLSKAKTSWRKLQMLETKGSQDWLDATYNVAWCCFALKEYGQCRKLIQVTRLRYPDLGGWELQTKFTNLERDAVKAEN